MEVSIKYEPFPEQLQGSTSGFTVARRGKYMVVIDSTRAGIVQRRTIGHELAHIFLGHFEKKIPTLIAEREADRRAWEYYRLYRDGQLEGVS